MKQLRRALAGLAALAACGGLLALTPAPGPGAGGLLTVAVADREAYSRIVWAAVPPEAQASVAQGRGLVRQTWVVSPSLDPGIAGLGPTYNRPACTACHARNGGAPPPDSPAEPMRSLLVRLSVPGQDAHGGPQPEPRYGDQLNEQGVPGVPGEGEAVLQWAPVPVTLADGTVITLRRPSLSFQHLAFGPMAEEVLTSVRVAPPMFGLGLLEAVPEADILALAEAQRRAGQGVAGQPNRVWDAVAGRAVLGRFGWKANQPSVRQQVAGALAGDMGITTPVFPTPNCPPVQTACAAWSADRHPELTNGPLDAITLYLQALGLPARREANG
ncbi:di-heme oxidoredictase family protein, partial [Ideonella sp. B508-1]|uniref:di-heme oxidoredictase family protein n=1 Tax=Ideonella sp. B508-1 TaxID=137716 RepID=UPI00047637B9